jgi:thiamine transport system permease protein
MRNAPAVCAGASVLILCFGTLIAVEGRAGAESQGLSHADWAAVRFTLTQAALSAALSVALAVPVARALARRVFPGRTFFITLLGAPFLLPVIVAILGLLAVFGRNGIFNTAFAAMGFEPFSIYGFHGVVLAHVFFNLPLATRLVLQGWQAVPAEHFRTAVMLNAPIGAIIEWPMLWRVLPNAALVIFLLCLTSFAVALTLGGGPRATTIELAIYQAVRFDFDLSRAALLAGVQFIVCAFAALTVWLITPLNDFGAGLDRQITRWDGSKLCDSLWISFAAVFLLLPMVMVLWRGLPELFTLPQAVWHAAGRSVVIAILSAFLTITLALTLALRRGAFVTVIGVLPMASSSLVLGTGLFLIVFPWVRPSDVALLVTILVNATLALPFAIRILAPAVAAAQDDFGRLSTHLNLMGWRGLWLVILPRVRRPLGFACGLAAALSMGDLGVIALFADENSATLPLMMYRLMGSYQSDATAGAGVLLAALSFALFWICDQIGRGHAGA